MNLCDIQKSSRVLNDEVFLCSSFGLTSLGLME